MTAARLALDEARRALVEGPSITVLVSQAEDDLARFDEEFGPVGSGPLLRWAMRRLGAIRRAAEDADDEEHHLARRGLGRAMQGPQRRCEISRHGRALAAHFIAHGADSWRERFTADWPPHRLVSRFESCPLHRPGPRECSARGVSGVMTIEDKTDRVVVIGGPNVGKTTYANERGKREGVEVRHTDDLIGVLDWSGVSHRIAFDWFAKPGPWIIEGVAGARALRKWLREHGEGKPCDEVVVLEHPWVELSAGQARMAKACSTVWLEVRSEVEQSGVRVVLHG